MAGRQSERERERDTLKARPRILFRHIYHHRALPGYTVLDERHEGLGFVGTLASSVYCRVAAISVNYMVSVNRRCFPYGAN
jgi:hypothetical protein